jgi:hypothetical protein
VHIAMNEILFIVEKANEGGFLARAVGQSIYTEADDIESLQRQIRDAVRCHFDEGKAPQRILLQFAR